MGTFVTEMLISLIVFSMGFMLKLTDETKNCFYHVISHYVIYFLLLASPFWNNQVCFSDKDRSLIFLSTSYSCGFGKGSLQLCFSDKDHSLSVSVMLTHLMRIVNSMFVTCFYFEQVKVSKLWQLTIAYFATFLKTWLLVFMVRTNQQNNS